MKKLYIAALIAGLSFGQAVFGMDFFKNCKPPHKTLNDKDGNVYDYVVEKDIAFLLEHGYKKVPKQQQYHTELISTHIMNPNGTVTTLSDMLIVIDQVPKWQCYLESPERKCVIYKNYLNQKFKTNYHK